MIIKGTNFSFSVSLSPNETELWLECLERQNSNYIVCNPPVQADEYESYLKKHNSLLGDSTLMFIENDITSRNPQIK